MSIKVSCTRCGAVILKGTAAKYAGLCAPCANGTREQIEQGKRWYAAEAERHRNPSPEDLLWTSLVHRVYRTPQSFAGLSQAEQVYYVTNILSGEVFNGGFDQYFLNSSGGRYRETRDALQQLGASRSLALLEAAANLLFEGQVVPIDEVTRRSQLSARSLSEAEEATIASLEKQFWDDPDDLGALLAAFAQRRGLLPPTAAPA